MVPPPSLFFELFNLYCLSPYSLILFSVLFTEFLILDILFFSSEVSMWLLCHIIYFFAEAFYLFICFKHGYNCPSKHFYGGCLKIPQIILMSSQCWAPVDYLLMHNEIFLALSMMSDFPLCRGCCVY